MAYNKRLHLIDNIRAIETALIVGKDKRKATNDEKITISKFSGFGGIKAVLHPIDRPEDWTKSDLSLHGDIVKMHDILKSYFNDKMYARYISSIQNSVLTSFYLNKVVILHPIAKQRVAM